jgi:hypothetical protein
MKKIICLIIILTVFASTSVFAFDSEYFLDGLLMGGLGAAGLITAYNINDPFWKPFTGVLGYGLSGLGLGFMLGGLLRRSEFRYTKEIEEDPVLNHVLFTTNGKDTFLGARFSF